MTEGRKGGRNDRRKEGRTEGREGGRKDRRKEGREDDTKVINKFKLNSAARHHGRYTQFNIINILKKDQ